jgi:hypothetical protein
VETCAQHLWATYWQGTLILAPQLTTMSIIIDLQLRIQCLRLFSRFKLMLVMISVFMLTILVPGTSLVSGSVCQIRDVSYTFPKQVLPNQQIQVGSTVAGSCVTDVYRFYLLRADLLDKKSGLIISSNSVPIGYNPRNFTVTVTNGATAPQESNATWPLEVRVYVILTGGGGLLDYYSATASVGEIQIQVGSSAIPEFPHQSVTTLLLTGSLALTFLLTGNKKRLKRRHREN